MSAGPAPLPERASGVRQVEPNFQNEVDHLGDLSDFFNPFLPHFVRAAFRGTGEVWVARAGTTIDGLLLYNGTERLGSIFTRRPEVAQVLFGQTDPVALFSEFPLSSRTETYHVFRTAPGPDLSTHRFTHPVRLARAEDQVPVLELLHEMYGRIDPSGFPVVPTAEEKCLLVEIAGEIVGVGWVTVVQGHGRLHSLSVRPHYRRVGIGRDLWYARMLWAARAGARAVVSEVADQNVASQAIATAGGMEKVGQLFLSYRPATAPISR